MPSQHREHPRIAGSTISAGTDAGGRGRGTACTGSACRRGWSPSPGWQPQPDGDGPTWLPPYAVRWLIQD